MTGTGSTVTVLARAKVNLALRVGPKRADGYHDLETVFMAVDLCDTVTCTYVDDGRIEVAVSGEGADLVPTDGSDLAGRAARLLRDRFGDPGLGVHLQIDKSIPVAGGMAGGSADAAAVLRGCNELWQLAVPEGERSKLAAELGADVPFALRGGVALAKGRGDVLTRLPCRGKYHWVFALAHEGLSTQAVYDAFDQLPAPTSRLETRALTDAMLAGDIAGVAAALVNDLQPAACSLRPVLGETLATGAVMDGVLGAVLAGSGPTCAFLCESPEAADYVAVQLANLPQVAGTRVADGPAGGATTLNYHWVLSPAERPPKAAPDGTAADTAAEAESTIDSSSLALDETTETDAAPEDDTSEAETFEDEPVEDELEEEPSGETLEDDIPDDETPDDTLEDESPDETTEDESSDEETPDNEKDEETTDGSESDETTKGGRFAKWFRRRRASKIVLIVVLSLILAVGGSLGIAYARLNGRITQENIEPMLGSDRPTIQAPTSTVTSPIDPYTGRALNIMVIGSDSRGNADPEMGQRSDTTFIAHISADRTRVDLVSIPRDTLITMPNCVYSDGSSVPGSGAKKQKFNAAFSFGSWGSKGNTASGAACTIRAIEAISGVHIDGFVVVDFAGFQQIIDAIGGVDIFLPCDVVSGEDWLQLSAGPNHLGGLVALRYARARIGPGLGDGSDLMRIQRQQVLFKAIAMKALSMNFLTNLTKMYDFVGSVADAITTDMGSALDLAGLAYSLRGIDTESITFNTVPIKVAKDKVNVEVVPDQAGPIWWALIGDTPVSDVAPPKPTPPNRVDGLPTPPPGMVSAPPWQCGW